MPLFYDWTDVVLGPLLAAAIVESTSETRAQGDAWGAKRDEEHQLRIERSRWLEEHRAERSFPCGLVPDPHAVGTGMPRLNVLAAPPMEVTAAVLSEEVAFIREGSDDVVEVGRIPRDSIVGIDVVDGNGGHVPEPIHETIEPPQLALLVLTWTNGGADDEDRFAFMSPWLAWRAGRRLMEARRG